MRVTLAVEWDIQLFTSSVAGRVSPAQLTQKRSLVILTFFFFFLLAYFVLYADVAIGGFENVSQVAKAEPGGEEV